MGKICENLRVIRKIRTDSLANRTKDTPRLARFRKLFGVLGEKRLPGWKEPDEGVGSPKTKPRRAGCPRSGNSPRVPPQAGRQAPRATADRWIGCRPGRRPGGSDFVRLPGGAQKRDAAMASLVQTGLVRARCRAWCSSRSWRYRLPLGKIPRSQ